LQFWLGGMLRVLVLVMVVLVVLMVVALGAAGASYHGHRQEHYRQPQPAELPTAT